MSSPREVFTFVMRTLQSKTKAELKQMLFDPSCPPLIRELIQTHPALLGNEFQELGPSSEHQPFVVATEEIIKAHGYSHTYEWEYELKDDKTHRPTVLRIWLGKKRTKKTLRELRLTDEEATRIQSILTGVVAKTEVGGPAKEVAVPKQ